MRLLLLAMGTVLAIPLVPIDDSAVDVNVTPSGVSVNVGSDSSGNKPDETAVSWLSQLLQFWKVSVHVADKEPVS